KAATRDRNVFGAAHVGECFRDALWVVVLLVRDQYGDGRGPGFVRITVGSDVESALSSIVDEFDEFGGFSPDSDGSELDVGDLSRELRLVGDADQLPG